MEELKVHTVLMAPTRGKGVLPSRDWELSHGAHGRALLLLGGLSQARQRFDKLSGIGASTDVITSPQKQAEPSVPPGQGLGPVSSARHLAN